LHDQQYHLSQLCRPLCHWSQRRVLPIYIQDKFLERGYVSWSRLRDPVEDPPPRVVFSSTCYLFAIHVEQLYGPKQAGVDERYVPWEIFNPVLKVFCFTSTWFSRLCPPTSWFLLRHSHRSYLRWRQILKQSKIHTSLSSS
jgi:hypothetical protein